MSPSVHSIIEQIFAEQLCTRHTLSSLDQGLFVFCHFWREEASGGSGGGILYCLLTAQHIITVN